jgi:RsiW-degrading membrane proteinase PrsW (M82 family)
MKKDTKMQESKDEDDDLILPVGWFALALPIFGFGFGLFVKRGIIRKDSDPERAEGLMYAFILMSCVMGFVLSFIGTKMNAPASKVAIVSNILVFISIVYFRWIYKV